MLLYISAVLLFSLAAVANSQPAASAADIPVCDFYANALFGSNTAASQLHLMTHLFNQAVVGNFPPTNKSVTVTGFANSQPYHGTYQTLGHYFDSTLNSSNLGGSSGGSKLLLDGGGPPPLLLDKPANDTSSNQYKLFTRAYYLWGELLNCSLQGGSDFPHYTGNPNMWEVHKFMDLGPNQMGLFIDELVFSALSVGFSKADADAYNYTLTSKYNYRCSLPRPISDSPQNYTAYPQSCCTAADCPIDPNGGDCGVAPYTEAVLVPTNITTDATSSGIPSGSSPGSSSTTASISASGSSFVSTSNAATGAVGENKLLVAGAAMVGAVVFAFS